MLTIKLIDVRMLLLRAAMKKEADRLQDVAAQVARISAGLDMDLKARNGIDEIMEKLRKNAKNQSSNWTVMQQLAETSTADLTRADEDLAKKARNLDYSMRQFFQKVQGGVSGLTGAIGTFAGWDPKIQNKWVTNVPSLNLGALSGLKATEKLGDLFDSVGSGFGDALRGVSLGELSTNGLIDKMEDALGDIDLKDAVTAAGAGVGALAGILGLTNLLDKSPSSLANDKKVFYGDPGLTKAMAFEERVGGLLDNMRSGSPGTSGAQEDILKASLNRAAGSLSNVDDVARDSISWLGGKARDAGEAAWDAITWLGGKAVDAGEAAWDGITWLGGKAVDAGEAVWDGMVWLDQKSVEIAKAVVTSKPMEYVWDMGGSVLGGGADILSFCANVGTLDFTGAAADGYSFINNFFDFSQDLSGLTIYGMGAGAEALGVDQEKVDFLYSEAEDYRTREGLAGELRAEGLDTMADVVQTTDAVVDTYKFFKGIDNFANGELKTGEHPMDTYRRKVYELSGWKLVDDYGDYATLQQRLDYFADVSSNVELGYKYLDGAFDGTLKPVLTNTQIGKLITAPGKILENLSDVVS